VNKRENGDGWTLGEGLSLTSEFYGEKAGKVRVKIQHMGQPGNKGKAPYTIPKTPLMKKRRGGGKFRERRRKTGRELCQKTFNEPLGGRASTSKAVLTGKEEKRTQVKRKKENCLKFSRKGDH